MATSKKTPTKKSKTVAKKPPSKTPPRIDYKPNTRVKVLDNAGKEFAAGRVAKVENTKTGAFIHVTFTMTKAFRATRVKGY